MKRTEDTYFVLKIIFPKHHWTSKEKRNEKKAKMLIEIHDKEMEIITNNYQNLAYL